MATYSITAPDGQELEFEGPDNATEEEIKAYAMSQWRPIAQGDNGDKAKEMVAAESATAEASTAELALGAPTARFAMGMASPVTALIQAGANLGDWIGEKTGIKGSLGRTRYVQAPNSVNGEITEDSYGPPAVDVNAAIDMVSEMKRRGMAARAGVPEGEEGWDVAGLAGAIMNPVGMAYSRVLPASNSLWEAIKNASKIGAFYGATTPVENVQGDYGQRKAMQIGFGGATGAVIPPAIGAAKWAGGRLAEIGDLVTPKGVNRIVDRYWANKIPEQNVAQLSYALRNAPEYVYGSKPTAAEAVAHLPEGTAIQAQQAVTAGTPGGGISAQFAGRALQQNRAREVALDTIAKDEAALKSAEGLRSANANINYQKAYMNAIRGDGYLISMSKNPFFRKALPDAVRLAKANGVNPKTNLTEFLHIVKLSLDKQMGKTGDTALSNTEKKAVFNLKERLVSWITKKNPDYDVARAQFATDSVPINKMQVGRLLKDKLVSPLATDVDQEATQRALSYAQAVRDAPKTIKDATGWNKYDDIGQVLDAGEVDIVTGIAKDLARKSASTKPLQKTNLQGGVNIGEETTARLPNLLSRPAMIANAILKTLSGRSSQGIESRIDEVMANQFLNPKELAAVLDRLPRKHRAAVLDAYMRGPTMGSLSVLQASQQ